MKEKKLVFDMDGTITDLYGVKDWLPKLRNEDVTPYAIAKPMYDMSELRDLLIELHELGWKIVVVTWLAMNASTIYKKNTRAVKKLWLDKYNFPYDEYHAVQYGTPKHYISKGLLFDDSEEVRNAWTGESVDVTEISIIEVLKSLIADEG